MRWQSVTWPTGCAVADPSCKHWPRYERVLVAPSGWNCSSCWPTTATISASRTAISVLKTRAAIREFQVKSGQVPDGFASAGILDQLRAQ